MRRHESHSGKRCNHCHCQQDYVVAVHCTNTHTIPNKHSAFPFFFDCKVFSVSSFSSPSPHSSSAAPHAPRRIARAISGLCRRQAQSRARPTAPRPALSLGSSGASTASSPAGPRRRRPPGRRSVCSVLTEAGGNHRQEASGTRTRPKREPAHVRWQ